MTVFRKAFQVILRALFQCHKIFQFCLYACTFLKNKKGVGKHRASEKE